METVKALVVKFVKTKFRSVAFTVLILVWPTLLFSMNFLSLNTKSEYKPGFFESQALPTNGLNEFTHGLLCSRHTVYNKTEASNSTFNQSNYKQLFESAQIINQNITLRHYFDGLIVSYLHFIVTSGVFYSEPHDEQGESPPYFTTPDVQYDPFWQNDLWPGTEDDQVVHEMNVSKNNAIFFLKTILEDDRNIGLLATLLLAVGNDNSTELAFCNERNDEIYEANVQKLTTLKFLLSQLFPDVEEIEISYKVRYNYTCFPAKNTLLSMVYALISRKIVLTPANADVTKIRDMLNSFFNLVQNGVLYTKSVLPLLENAACAYKNVLSQSSEALYVNSRPFFETVGELFSGQTIVPVTFSVFPEIVPTLEEARKKIISPLRTEFGSVIGVNIINSDISTKKINYSILISSDTITDYSFYYRFPSFSNHNIFMDSFWIPIQEIIDFALMSLNFNDTNLYKPKKTVKNAPNTCFSYDQNLFVKVTFTPTLFLISLCASCMFICRYLVQEKQFNLNSYLSSIGINPTLYTCFTLLLDVLFTFITFFPVILLIYQAGIVKLTSPGYIFLAIVGYTLASYSMTYLVTIFCSNPTIGQLIVSQLTFFGSLPSVVIRFNLFNITSSSVYFFSSLFVQSCFSEFIYELFFIEFYVKEQLDQSVFNKSFRIRNEFNVGFYLMMLYVDALLYLVLGIMISQLRGKEILTKLRKMLSHRNNYTELVSESGRGRNSLQDIDRDDYRILQTPIWRNPLVAIDNLTVTYDKKTYALNHLSLDLLENNLYIILGENGSGKSTLIKAILNQIPYTGSVTYNMEVNSKGIGYCPQHDVLIRNLTVIEHLYFYWRIKTKTSPYNHSNEIMNIVSLMKMEGLINLYAEHLSGGQKRKLSISVATIGNPKCILLDEPTSGVDSDSKLGVYDLISSIRHDKTLVISTHCPDEAEIFGENIIVMSSGSIIERGDSVSLKEKYRMPTKLIIEKTNSDVNDGDIIDFVQLYAYGYEASHIRPNEIIFDFNNAFKKHADTQYFFEQLYSRRSSLGIKNFSINDPFMEQILVKIIENQSRIDEQSDEITNENFYNNSQDIHRALITELKKERVVPSIAKKIFIMGKRRFIHSYRDRSFYCLQLLTPIIFQLIGCLMEFMIMYYRNDKLPININGLLIYMDVNLPMQHERINTQSEYNSLYKYLLKDYGWVMRNPHWSLNESCTFGTCDLKCAPYANSTCMYDGTTTRQDRKMYNSSIYLPIKNYPKSNYELIGDCDIEDHLILVNRLQPFRRYFSIKYGKKHRHDAVAESIEVIGADGENMALPIGNNFINNLILKMNAFQQNISDYSEISLEVSHELVIHSRLYQLLTKYFSLSNFIVLSSVGFCLCLLTFSFEPISEKATGFKKSQFLLGMNDLSYWIGYMLIDMSIYICMCTLCLPIYKLFNLYEYVDNSHLPILLLNMFLFGFSATPLSYLMTHFFKSKSAALIVLILFSYFITVLCTILEPTRGNDAVLSPTAQNIIFNITRLIPYYNFPKVLLSLSMDAQDIIISKTKITLATFQDIWISYILVGIALFFSTIFLPYLKKLRRINIEKQNHGSYISRVQDLEVQMEESFTSQEANLDNSQIIIKNLSKIYASLFGNTIIRAVDNISFSLRKGECMGLLGTNGAGKTTTFKIVVEEEVQSNGEIIKESTKDRMAISYCSQFDNLDMHLTPREHIMCFCQLAGYDAATCRAICHHALITFGLQKFADVVVKNMSFGNRRRVSFFLSFIGNPNTILLDEPTSGMDPSIRAVIWSFINEMKKEGKSILFTSHSMNECELYAERILIMVKGRIRCIGSPEHIIQRYGKGYELRINFDPIYFDIFNEKILSYFPLAKFKHSTGSYFVYILDMDAKNMHMFFDLIKNLKIAAANFRYSIQQNNLETVFQRIVTEPT